MVKRIELGFTVTEDNREPKDLCTVCSYIHRMKREEFRHDLCMATFSTDHVLMMPEYNGKILVGDNRRGTGIIRKTCEAGNIGTMNRYIRALYLSPGFSNFKSKNIGIY